MLGPSILNCHENDCLQGVRIWHSPLAIFFDVSGELDVPRTHFDAFGMQRRQPTMPSGCFAKTPKASLRHRSGIVETRAVSPGSSMFPESANRTTRAVSPGSAIRTTQETRRKHRIALPRGHRNRTKGETRRGHHIRTTPETSRLHTTCTIFLALALRV